MLDSAPALRRSLLSATNALAVLLLAIAAMTGASHAGVQIKGTAKSLRVDVTKTPIADVLAALEPKFQVRYRTELPLDQEIDGAYRGSLRRVISRVLKGYNYFVKRDGKTMEIVIFEKQQQVQPGLAPQDRLRYRRNLRRRNRRYED